MQYLKKDTACSIMFGPFVDKTDGVTLLTDATTITDIDHATTGIFLSKNGNTTAVRHQGVTASVAAAYGMMYVILDTTDMNTAGTLDVLFAKAATYLPVFKSFMVLPANVFNSLLGTDLLDVSLVQVNGAAQTATLDTIKAETALIVEDTGTTIPGTITTAQGNITSILADTGELQTNQGGWLTPTGFATPTNITAGTITTVTNLTNAPTNGDLTATMKTSVQAAMLSAGGSAGTARPYTLTDADTAASIVGAMVWVSEDITGATIRASGITNASGIVTFTLAAGTYYIWRSKAGYNFTNPDVEVLV